MINLNVFWAESGQTAIDFSKRGAEATTVTTKKKLATLVQTMSKVFRLIRCLGGFCWVLHYMPLPTNLASLVVWHAKKRPQHMQNKRSQNKKNKTYIVFRLFWGVYRSMTPEGKSAVFFFKDRSQRFTSSLVGPRILHGAEDPESLAKKLADCGGKVISKGEIQVGDP